MKHDISVGTLIAIIAIGIMIRAIFAPHTAGPDIPQFAGFANTFLRHGLCLFRYVGTIHSKSEGWPYPWPYCYGVLPILLLGLARIIAPQGLQVEFSASTYRVLTPVEWIIATKTIYIVFDSASALLIYLIASRWSKRLALLATVVYFLNPLTIYISSIFGQLDPIAITLFLAGLLIYIQYADRHKDLLVVAGLLVGLSMTTKLNMIPLIGVFIVYSIARYTSKHDKTSQARLLIGFILGAVVPYLIFEASCPGGLYVLYTAIIDVGRVGYYHSLIYSFNGITSLASYMHIKTGKDFLRLIENWWVTAGLLYMLLLTGSWVRKQRNVGEQSLIELLYLAYLVYLSTYWKIHYQYFVGLLALYALLIIDKKVDFINKLLASVHTVVFSSYVIMYPASFWAWFYIKDPDTGIISLLDKLSLRIYDEEIYLLYSLILTFIGNLVVTSYFITSIAKTSPVKYSTKWLKVESNIETSRPNSHKALCNRGTNNYLFINF